MISFSVDPSTKLRIAVFEGIVDDRQLLEAYGRLLESPDYDPGLDDLVDLRAVTRLEVSRPALQQLIRLYAPVDQQGIPTRLAMVAGSSLAFGMSRMYEMMRGEDVPEVIRVFNDYAEALGWLLG